MIFLQAVKSIRFILLVIFLGIFLSNNVLAQESEPIELYYDDGNPNIELTFGVNASSYLVTRFTPPEGKVQILTAVYFLADTANGVNFIFRILPDAFGEPWDGNELYGPVPITKGNIGWNELDLSDFNITVEGDFYLMLQYDGYSNLTFGAENRDPLSGRTYDTDC